LPTLFMLVIFLPLVFLALWCLLRALVWRVEVDGERIVFTSFIGKKTKFTFKDITLVTPSFTQTGHSVKVYIGRKKIFTADQGCENFYILISRLAERESQQPA